MVVFFLVALAVKLPIPVITLCIISAVPLYRFIKSNDWHRAAPFAAVLGVLIVTLTVKYTVGTRHVMVVFPLLAVLAGCGADHLWNVRGHWRHIAFLSLAALLIWEGGLSVRAHPDYLAYFNELAGQDPSRILVMGCDLDCGQDLGMLSRELHSRGIETVNLAIWTSADLSQSHLPSFQIMTPNRPIEGWVAISLRALRLGDVLHSTYPPDAFAWLECCRPVAHVGKTILLYNIKRESLPK